MPTFNLENLAPATINLALADRLRAEVVRGARMIAVPPSRMLNGDARVAASMVRRSLARGDIAAASAQWGALLALRDIAREMRG